MAIHLQLDGPGCTYGRNPCCRVGCPSPQMAIEAMPAIGIPGERPQRAEASREKLRFGGRHNKVAAATEDEHRAARPDGIIMERKIRGLLVRVAVIVAENQVQFRVQKRARAVKPSSGIVGRGDGRHGQDPPIVDRAAKRLVATQADSNHRNLGKVNGGLPRKQLEHTVDDVVGVRRHNAESGCLPCSRAVHHQDRESGAQKPGSPGEGLLLGCAGAVEDNHQTGRPRLPALPSWNQKISGQCRRPPRDHDSPHVWIDERLCLREQRGRCRPAHPNRALIVNHERLSGVVAKSGEASGLRCFQRVPGGYLPAVITEIALGCFDPGVGPLLRRADRTQGRDERILRDAHDEKASAHALR